MVPELVAISAVDLGHDELDILGNQLALLPCHRFTGFVASPYLPIIALKIHLILCETAGMSGDRGTQGYAVRYYCIFIVCLLLELLMLYEYYSLSSPELH